MDIFTVLPSNVKAESYPDNTISNFTTPLPIRLNFPRTDQWKVGLLEIQIPITFYNIDDSLEENIIILNAFAWDFEIKILPGFYTKVADIVQEINEKIKDKNCNSIQFEYDSSTRKVQVVTSDGDFVILSERLAKIFSLPRKLGDSLINQTHYFKSETYADPWKDFYHFFIESDLVENQILNEKLVPLLETVPINSYNFGELLVKKFSPLNYLNIASEHYSTITIRVLDEIARPVRFRGGSVTLKLYFNNEKSRRNQSGFNKYW